MTTSPAIKRLAAIIADMEKVRTDAVAEARMLGATEAYVPADDLKRALGQLNDLCNDMVSGTEEVPLAPDTINPPMMYEIIAAVCEVFGVTATELKKPSRHRRFSYPRFAFFWIARRVYPVHGLAVNARCKSWREISQAVGRTDHSTAISGWETADQLMQQNGDFAHDVRTCLRLLSIKDTPQNKESEK
jgi:Bacterial dnaA protein helix-turn-helix